MKTAHLEVDVPSDACPPDSPGGTQNEEGDENRASDAGIKSKLVTWFALAAFVVAAVAFTALAGSSVPSTLLREHTGSESEGRELRRRYREMSIWFENIYDAEDWGVGLYMDNWRDDVILKNYQTRYVTKPVSRDRGRSLVFQVRNLPKSQGMTRLINYVIETDATRVTYTASVEQYGRAERYVNVYVSTYFDERAPYCNRPEICDCYYFGRVGSKRDKVVWKCELDFKNGGTNRLNVRAV